jgi:hypothetical protein
MNRRMPNGTYGGVRGWGREAPANSIGVDNNQMLNSGKEGENQDFRKYFSTLRNCTVHLLINDFRFLIEVQISSLYA